MARTEKTIFISYRRKDISWALLVYKYLTEKKYDVFFDFTSIPSGDFEQIIVSNIRARAHFLLILTPTALDRCDDPDDWLRREIETAIDEKRNIIPLFFDGFRFDAPGIASKLTGKLAAIRRYNGLEIPANYFEAGMERLCSQYLNVPLNAVIHPVPSEVRKVVKEEQSAANQALEQNPENIEELVKPAAAKMEEKIPVAAASPAGGDAGKSPNYRQYGMIAGIVVLLMLGILGINSLLRGNQGQVPPPPTKTSTATHSVKPTSTSKEATPTRTPAAVATNTLVKTPVPTLGIGSTEVSRKDNMTLLYVPAGEFTMGDDEGFVADQQPSRTVSLDAFWIDQTEVTNAMYAKCVAADGCTLPPNNWSNTRPDYYINADYENFPVIHVTWEAALNYCSWAGRRLPTEAEWEKAARGEDGRLYPWGDGKPAKDLANNKNNPGKDTTEVGQFPAGASPYGALDMAGNVSEWANDWYASDTYQNSPSSNPSGPPSGEFRVHRGGSWIDTDMGISSTFRYWSHPGDAVFYLGFRCARDAAP